MIVGVSFQDVLEIEEFKGMHPFSLLPRKMDTKVFPYLYKIGCNIDVSCSVQACKHRTFSGKEIVGYRYVFFERLDKEWLNNPWCSIGARIQSQKDKWLAADMIRASSQGIGESGFKAMAMSVAGKEGTTNKSYCKKGEVVEDYEATSSMIRALRNIQEDVRGALTPEEDMFYTWRN